jgi:thiosulfate reductase cytochrome b subunit
MSVMEQGAPAGFQPGARNTAAILSIVGGIAGGAVILADVFAHDAVASWGLERNLDVVPLSLLAAGVAFTLAGGFIALMRLGLGGTIVLCGALLWMAGCVTGYSFGWLLAIPVVLAFLGALTGMIANDAAVSTGDSRLILRQDGVTRLTHWVWAVAMFFLLLSGLGIFNARPNLYIGQQSGFGFHNSIVDIFAVNTPNGPRGQTNVLGQTFDTTGVLGMSGPAAQPDFTAFPQWATIPARYDLATSRVVHFFFAWILVGTLFIWVVNALITGHLWRDIILKPRDIRELPADIISHIKLRFTHGRTYSPLQKIAYFGVLVIAFPLIILTGLTMSPGMDTAWPWLLDLFGGRQTARTIHFFTMAAFVLFFVVHIIMVILANPLNELRSMITGYYRTNIKPGSDEGGH